MDENTRPRRPDSEPNAALARLIAQRGTTTPKGDLLTVHAEGTARRPKFSGPPSQQVLDELRADRL